MPKEYTVRDVRPVLDALDDEWRTAGVVTKKLRGVGESHSKNTVRKYLRMLAERGEVRMWKPRAYEYFRRL